MILDNMLCNTVLSNYSAKFRGFPMKTTDVKKFIQEQEPIRTDDSWAPVGKALACSYNSALLYCKSDYPGFQRSWPFMRAYLPYCVLPLAPDGPEDTLIVLNREYKPVGLYADDSGGHADYLAYPWLHLKLSSVRTQALQVVNTRWAHPTHLYIESAEPWKSGYHCAEYLARYRSAFFWWI